MPEPATAPAAPPWDVSDDPSRETIALLTEELARLEAELRARDEAEPDAPVEDPGAAARAAATQARVDGLVAELASRDETVMLLLEQSRLFEEAAAAQKAEWEQLHQWVEEVERRVEGRDAGDGRLREELDAERSRAATFRKQAEADRRTWDAMRRGLEREAEQLRELLVKPTGEAGDGTDFIALASENRRLRAANGALERAAAEAEELGKQLAAARADAAQARADLRQAYDERQRGDIEHGAELAAARSDRARATLEQTAAASPAEPAAGRPSALDADERIRAFRQHLKELHDHEAGQRAGRSLSSRLSRLWRHTGPGG